MAVEDERGTLDQVAYGLIFTRDLTDPAVVERLAGLISSGRGFASSPSELIASIDSALARRRIHPGTVEISGHSEADLLDFLARLRAAL